MNEASDVSLEKALKLKDMLKELEQDMREIDTIAERIRAKRKARLAGTPYENLPSPQEHVKILEELEVPPLELLEEEPRKKKE